MAYISFQPSDFFNTLLWTGDGSASRSLTGVGFQPDFTWIKPRSTTIEHNLYDSPRGATWALQSNNDEAQGQNNGYGWLSAFDADGFTVVEGGSNASRVNDNTVTYVGWNWKAGTTTGIAGSPSITPSSYSFNQTAGFSIVRYTANNTAGATLPHGLGVAPDMALFKCDSYAENWNMYNKNLTGGTNSTYTLRLNNTAAEATMDNYNDTAQTSTTLFTVGNTGEINEGTRTYVAYFFKEKKGYSKFGSYTGNGNANGTFIYLGFRPAFVIIKRSSSTGNWTLWDDKRLGYNVANNEIQPNLTSAEDVSSHRVDLLSNGFKLRDSSPTVNDGTYIYMAFAEFPTVSSNDIPGVAR